MTARSDEPPDWALPSWDAVPAEPDDRVGRLAPPPTTPGVDWTPVTAARPGLLRTWPHRHDADAFFAARLVRSR